jgi:predicted alpha-1,6-mannanase (GH76 family)
MMTKQHRRASGSSARRGATAGSAGHQKASPSGRLAGACLALVALVAVATAGCGSGAAPGPPPTAPASSPSSLGGSPAGAPGATPAGQAAGPTALALARRDRSRARAALQAFDRAFYVASGPGAYWALDTSGGQATFYRQAEMIEMVEDAYQATGDPACKKMIVALERGVVASFGRGWQARPYNDDVLWMVIANLRAYELTGDRQYLTMARQNFDATYARGWSADLGGGLWWMTSPGEKNVTTNAPAAIAACLLAADLHDPSYLAKARRLYGWVRTHLYNPGTGEVYDRLAVTGSGVSERKVALTYNQGSFIGAADLLYRATAQPSYYQDALRTLQFSRTGLARRDGILPGEAGGPDSNGGGFKGIFCRWAVGFAHGHHLTSFDAWFQQNADAAWSHRDSRGLMGPFWSRPTSPGLLYSWDCSSAVVLLQVISR